MAYTEGDGVWRTIRGRRVFLENSKSLYASMVRSGKFPEMQQRRKTLWLPKEEHAHVMHELNTHYESFRDQKRVAKCIGDYVYIFDNYGFDSYRITGKYPIVKETPERRKARERF